MSSINYKVIFKGELEESEKQFSLTFKHVDLNKPVHIPAQIILELKKLSKISQIVVFFQNIKEVVIIGKTAPLQNYNYYFVILFTNKSDGKKEGYLIGNVKKLGDILIGIWPFNKDLLEESSATKITEKMNDLIKNPHEFNEICLIS